MKFSVQRGLVFLLGALFLVATSDLSALDNKKKKKGEIHTQNEKEAGADFLIQGEYTGNIQLGQDAEPIAVAVQVIAGGAGQFTGKSFKGGLPGAGAEEGEDTRDWSGKTEGDTTVLKMKRKDDDRANVEIRIAKGRAQIVVISDNDGQEYPIGVLERVVRLEVEILIREDDQIIAVEIMLAPDLLQMLGVGRPQEAIARLDAVALKRVLQRRTKVEMDIAPGAGILADHFDDRVIAHAWNAHRADELGCA